MVTITVDSQLSGLVLNYQLFLFNWGKGRGGALFFLFLSLENLVCEVHMCFTDVLFLVMNLLPQKLKI